MCKGEAGTKGFDSLDFRVTIIWFPNCANVFLMISVSTVPNNSFIFAAFFTILNGYAFFSKKTIILS